MRFNWDSFTRYKLCKRNTKRLLGRMGPHFYLLEEEREIKHITILKVFISYAKQMYNLCMNEDWLDVKLWAVTLIGLIFIWYRKWFGCIRMQMSSFEAMAPVSSYEKLHHIYDSVMGKTSTVLLCITCMCGRKLKRSTTTWSHGIFWSFRFANFAYSILYYALFCKQQFQSLW